MALVGVPTDLGLTQRSGARHGPREIRNQSCNVLYYNPQTKVIPFELARIADIGDVPIVSAVNLDHVVEELHAFYVGLREAGIVPVSAGGDHSITYPILKALGAGRPLGLVHVDAHVDCTDRIADSTLHHGSPFRNAVLDGALDPKRTVHIAIRDPAAEFETFAAETGQTVIDIDRFYELGVKGVVAETRRIVGDGPTYISFDIDGLDPAYAPGTGAPVVGGITSYDTQPCNHDMSKVLTYATTFGEGFTQRRRNIRRLGVIDKILVDAAHEVRHAGQQVLFNGEALSCIIGDRCENRHERTWKQIADGRCCAGSCESNAA